MEKRKAETPQNTIYPLKHRVRFVTAAALFDGHDAAINIMRRILQTSGAEVVHLGHNRSAQEIVEAALQEDAQAIAISSYQGGHVEFFKYVIDLLKKNHASHIRVFGGGGGTITLTEARDLEAYGVTRIYSPDDGRELGLQGIINDMLKRTDQPVLENVKEKELAHFSDNFRALAQALTVLEAEELGEGKAKHPWRDLISKKEKSGVVIGMTGTGGAGKSSLTDEILIRLLERFPKDRIACLAVDPTRRKTGGALLGDRLRFNSLTNPRAYLRSYATREANVSISKATEAAIELLRHAGFQWIFVETGGIGQSDTAIVELVDYNIYVMTSEFGAPTQLEKINMLDYADMVVINKFDKAGALDALTDVRKQLRRNHREWERHSPDYYPVFGTIASRFADPGVNQLVDHLVEVTQNKAKFALLKNQYQPLDVKKLALIPKEKTPYLSEIAQTVRSFHAKVTEECAKLADREALKRILSESKALSESSRSELTAQLDAVSSDMDPDFRAVYESFDKLSKRYEGENFEYQVRGRSIKIPLLYQTLSGNKLPKVVTPQMVSPVERFRFALLENLPGYFPYTAGVFPFKRTEEDPKRMFAGEGPPERTNKRFHLLCDGEKAKRLSTAFDSVTLYGEDPDERPDIYGKIGESGVSICSLDDMKKLYAGFDLCDPSVSVSMTINGPAPILLAFFFNTAIDQQVERFKTTNGRAPNESEWNDLKAYTLRSVRGTVQADILKEDQAQNTCIFSTEFALRMMGDIQQYFIDNEVRNYYSVSISGYHIAEAGANPISQLAFTLANGFTYVEYYLARGMSIDDFAPNLSFFFSNALDPEYTVIGRVARRIWSLAMKYRYGANDRSQKLKYHIQTSGRSLHAQEMSFNDIRTTLQALVAYFDHCNSLHTNAYDEAVTTPTDESVRRAMAIQLIIAKEFGWAKTENPHQGSFFIEKLTDLVEEAVLQEFDRISARAGVLGAMETQYQRSKIQEESLHYEHQKHSGELPIVGVNTFLNSSTGKMADVSMELLTRASYEEKNHQIKHLHQFQKKNAAVSTQALQRLKEVAKGGGNIFESLMDAARVCSLGQVSHALYEIGGKYRRGV